MKVINLVNKVNILNKDLNDVISTLKNIHNKYKNYNLTNDQIDAMVNEMRKDERRSVIILITEYVELKNELNNLLDKDIDFISDRGGTKNDES